MFERLSERILKELKDLGFVHVSGLFRCDSKRSYVVSALKADACDFGSWTLNDSSVSIVTHDGQVWQAAVATGNEHLNRLDFLLNELCDNGEKNNAYLRIKDLVNSDLLFRRLQDPYCDCDALVHVPASS